MQRDVIVDRPFERVHESDVSVGQCALPVDTPAHLWILPGAPETEVEGIEHKNPHRGPLVAIRTRRLVMQIGVPFRSGPYACRKGIRNVNDCMG